MKWLGVSINLVMAILCIIASFNAHSTEQETILCGISCTLTALARLELR